jgi:hypothetical protein
MLTDLEKAGRGGHDSGIAIHFSRGRWWQGAVSWQFFESIFEDI